MLQDSFVVDGLETFLASTCMSGSILLIKLIAHRTITSVALRTPPRWLLRPLAHAMEELPEKAKGAAAVAAASSAFDSNSATVSAASVHPPEYVHSSAQVELGFTLNATDVSPSSPILLAMRLDTCNAGSSQVEPAQRFISRSVGAR